MTWRRDRVSSRDSFRWTCQRRCRDGWSAILARRDDTGRRARMSPESRYDRISIHSSSGSSAHLARRSIRDGDRVVAGVGSALIVSPLLHGRMRYDPARRQRKYVCSSDGGGRKEESRGVGVTCLIAVTPETWPGSGSSDTAFLSPVHNHFGRSVHTFFE